MSEMVEKLARALYCNMEGVTNCPENEAHLAYWFGDDADAKMIGDEYRSAARAALQAMREPTDAMLRVGRLERGFEEISDEQGAKNIWTAMLDAALEDPRHG